jgi:hypothetical protein
MRTLKPIFHYENIKNYLPLVEIREMWHQDQVQITPIIIFATGTTPKKEHSSIRI